MLLGLGGFHITSLTSLKITSRGLHTFMKNHKIKSVVDKDNNNNLLKYKISFES
jgi:hypothetical protein